MLELRNYKAPIHKDGKPLFELPSFVLGRGEKWALTGASGSGKTTFLRSLCLMTPLMSGGLRWNGKEVSPEQVPEYRAKVLYVGQRSLLPSGTVASAFEEVFRFRTHRSKSWDRKKTQDAFRAFGKAADFLNQRTDSLSGGEKQLVCLVRAVALSPDVLCLDEPTSALDSATAETLESWLVENYSGAWIWVTHHERQALRVASRRLDLAEVSQKQS